MLPRKAVMTLRSLSAMARLCRVAALVALGLSGTLRPARAQLEPAREYQVKAAFLLNFARLTDWPDEAFSGTGSPIVICVLGEDPFGPALDEMVKGKLVRGRRLEVRRVKDPAEIKICHILFVAASEKENLVRVFAAISGSGILTVGEVEGFAQRGGIINFTIADNRVRFEINPRSIERARLRLGSQLLTLARLVKDSMSDASPPGQHP